MAITDSYLSIFLWEINPPHIKYWYLNIRAKTLGTLYEGTEGVLQIYLVIGWMELRIKLMLELPYECLFYVGFYRIAEIQLFVTKLEFHFVQGFSYGHTLGLPLLPWISGNLWFMDANNCSWSLRIPSTELVDVILVDFNMFIFYANLGKMVDSCIMILDFI